MSVEYYTNNLDALADDESLQQMRRQLLSDALDQNEFNTKKRRNEYVGTVISNRQEADFPQRAAKGSSIAVKIRLDDAQDEYLPDFCKSGYTPKQKLILESCHGSAISKSPLSMKNGEKVPKFGDRLSLFYSQESPDFYGRMRDLRYTYPTSKTEGKVVCPPSKPLPVKKAELLGDKIQISDKIEFAFNKWNIKKISYSLLNDVAEILKLNPHIKIKIEGHTDSRGSAEYNKKLSENRVESVFQYLRKAGVPFTQMPESHGWGEEKPIEAACASDNPLFKKASRAEKEVCHQRNRRVEFNIIGGPQRGKKLTKATATASPPTVPAVPATGILKNKTEIKKKKEEAKLSTPPSESKPTASTSNKTTESASKISNSKAWENYYRMKIKAETNPMMKEAWNLSLDKEIQYRREVLESNVRAYAPRHRGMDNPNSPPPQTSNK